MQPLDGGGKAGMSSRDSLGMPSRDCNEVKSAGEGMVEAQLKRSHRLSMALMIEAQAEYVTG